MRRTLSDTPTIGGLGSKIFALTLPLLLGSPGHTVFANEAETSPSADNPQELRLAPGDYKQSYADADYTTDSLSLENRKGSPANLIQIATTSHLGLPAVATPADNKPDSDKIALGRKLFFDRRLSRNKTMSCAMCHIPEQGFTNNELARPIGFEGRGLKRNAPTILNAAFYQRLFWDSREFSLEQQVWAPLLAANEMNNPSIGYVVESIRAAADYDGLFETAFGSPVTMQNIGLALAQYERALIGGNSRFDRWYFNDEKNALSSNEIAGFELFRGKARCAACHLVGQDSALFTDNQLHNTGIGYADSMLKGNEPVSVQLAPGISTKMDPAQIRSVSEGIENDLGAYEVSQQPADRWKFRTPILRNVALTAPYMHNGELLSLAEVVEFYDQGGVPNELLSPLIQPLGLSDQEKQNLVAFLKSLNSDNLRTLVADAFAAPIGDTKGGDPRGGE